MHGSEGGRSLLATAGHAGKAAPRWPLCFSQAQGHHPFLEPGPPLAWPAPSLFSRLPQSLAHSRRSEVTVRSVTSKGLNLVLPPTPQPATQSLGAILSMLVALSLPAVPSVLVT